MMNCQRDEGEFKRKSHDQPTHLELPFHDYPTLEEPSEFYKVCHRISENSMSLFMGLKFHEFSKFQEDYIVSLTNIFMKDCPSIKLIVIRPNLLYGQVDISLGNELNFNVETRILEETLFFLLKYAKIAFEIFIVENLNAYWLLDKNFKYEELMEKFKRTVVEAVRGKESELFDNERW